MGRNFRSGGVIRDPLSLDSKYDAIGLSELRRERDIVVCNPNNDRLRGVFGVPDYAFDEAARNGFITVGAVKGYIMKRAEEKSAEKLAE